VGGLVIEEYCEIGGLRDAGKLSDGRKMGKLRICGINGKIRGRN
jgi:hypothetical protein